jgi:H+-transporting ATPase
VLDGIKDRGALAACRQTRFVPFDPIRKRTEAEIQGPDGRAFQVAKGAPQIVLELCRPPEDVAKAADAKVTEFAGRGYRTLGVARKDGPEGWKFLGLLPLFDPPREDSAETIREANRHGIQVKMVTGDNLAIARQISGQLGLGTNIHTADEFFKDLPADADLTPKAAAAVEAAEGFAQVFPEHKYQIVRALQLRGHIVGMTGDGVNDAPALKQADTGIAVSGATDAARAASEVVLTAPGLSTIIRAVETARTIFERMNSYAIYRITETIRIMVFVVLAMLVYNFYPITALMIILLAFANDVPILAIAYDNTWLNPNPVHWNMRRVLSVSTVLGLVGVVETFGLLALAKTWLDLSEAQIQTLIFLKLAIAGHLTLFVARTRQPFLTKPYPAPVLLWSAVGTKVLVTLFVAFGLGLVAPISWTDIGLVWGYCLVWVFIEDWAKLAVYHHLKLASPRHRGFIGRLQEKLHPYQASP